MFQTLPLSTVINLFTTRFQAVGPVNRFLVEGLKDLIQDLTMKLYLARRDHSLPKEKTTFQRKLPSMEIKVRTTLFQLDGQDNRFLVEDLKDLIQDLTMKLFLARRDHSLPKEKTTFQRKLPSMEIKVRTTLFQPDGQDNRFLVEDLKDQTLALMTKQFSEEEDLSLTKEKNMFQKKHQSMEINLYTIPFQEAGQDSRSQVDNLKDQTLVLMTKQFSEEEDLSLTKEKNMFQKKHQSMVINHFTIQCQVDGLDSKFQEEDLKGQTLVLMMKQF